MKEDQIQDLVDECIAIERTTPCIAEMAGWLDDPEPVPLCCCHVDEALGSRSVKPQKPKRKPKWWEQSEEA